MRGGKPKESVIIGREERERTKRDRGNPWIRCNQYFASTQTDNISTEIFFPTFVKKVTSTKKVIYRGCNSGPVFGG